MNSIRFGLILLCFPLSISTQALSWKQASAQNPDGKTVFFHQPDDKIPWKISSRGSDDIADFSVLESSIETAFKTWNDVECSDVEFVKEGITDNGCDQIGYNPDGENENLITWCDDSWDPGYPQEALALTVVSYDEETGEILDCDVAFNGYLFSFAVLNGEDCNGLHDIQNTMTHEAGHMLGFDESNVPGSTMFPYTQPCDTSKRTLEIDDIDGLCTMYPSGKKQNGCKIEVADEYHDFSNPHEFYLKFILVFLIFVIMRKKFFQH